MTVSNYRRGRSVRMATGSKNAAIARRDYMEYVRILRPGATPIALQREIFAKPLPLTPQRAKVPKYVCSSQLR
jgi:hypothetical protein